MPFNRLTICLLCLLLFGHSPLAKAQYDYNLEDTDEIGIEELYGDDELVSIATGSSKPVYKAPAVATVINAKQIKAMGARTLDEVLETVPGLHVGLSTQGRLDSVYSIRGIHTKFNPQVLILMNGISFPSLSGRPLHFQLPVAAIDRIEVIRGPGSAVYGADAFSGVINIITKDAQSINGTEAGARVGSFDSQDYWLQHGGQISGIDVALSMEWQQTDGDDDRTIGSDFQSALDQTFGTSASLAPGPLDTRKNNFNSHLDLKKDEWSLHYWYWDQDDAGLGAGSALALDPDGGEDVTLHMVDLSHETDKLLPSLSLKTSVHYVHTKNDSKLTLLPAGSTAPIDSDGNLAVYTPAVGPVTFTDGMLGNPAGTHEQVGFDLVADYKGFSSHRLRFGSGIRYFSLEATRETKNYGPGVIDGTVSPIDGSLTNVVNTPYIFIDDQDRTLWYLSLQDEWQFAPDWDLTAGIRYDHYSDFGNTINPRIALVWSTRHNLTTKFLYGRAFRAPTFNELYSINNPVALGNPDLDPETIDTLELSFDYRPTFDLQTVVSTYYYIANDLIDFSPDITAQNARDQIGYGFEMEVSWQALKQLIFYANYSWQRAEDKDSGKRIADAPGQQIYLSSTWEFKQDWALTPQLNWVGHRTRAEGDARPDVDDYTLANLTLQRKSLYNHLDLSFSVKNIFDEKAYEPSTPIISDDYLLEGRSLWAEIRYRF